MTRAPVVIAAGGTGGHMFPALAVAEALRRRGCPVTLLTDARGKRWVGAEVDCRVVEAASPTGALRAKLEAVAALGRGLRASRRILAELKPAAVATFGGYASVPAALAAAFGRIPFLVHEQNAVLGRANRLVARLARALALSFERTVAIPKGVAPLVTGNPVRPGFTVEAAPTHVPDDGFRVLVLGGSQGARVFSDVLPEAMAAMPRDLRARLRLVQQCRPEDRERARAAYGGLGMTVELASFFEDVPARMSAADLVVARSGASTVAELLTLGKPAVLVPYPFAADDHQTANAKALAEAGAAILLPQPEATPARLAQVLAGLVRDPAWVRSMADAARNLAKPDAAERLADVVLAIARKEPRP